MTPLLILVLGTKPVVAIGTDLAYAAITAPVPLATVLALPAVLGLAAFINSRRTRRERVRLAEIAA